MHTLLVHQAFVSPQEPGGTRHFELAQRAVAQGNEFTIVAGNLNYKTGKQIIPSSRLVEEQTIGGIRVLRAYIYPSLHRSFTWRVVAFISFMVTSVLASLRVGRVDLVMTTTPPIFQALSTWLVAFLRRKPFLLEVRDLWPEFAVQMGVVTNPALITLARWVESFLYAQATHILINSPGFKPHLLQKGVKPEKISVVANGGSLDMFNPDADGQACRAQWQLEGKFIAMYAGAMGQANDLPTILRSAKRLEGPPEIEFVFVGDGKERANTERMAQEMGLSNVYFVGPVPKNEMRHVLAAADVCLATLLDIPMFNTVYPNKVFDYMAAGRPTVLGIDGVIRKVVEGANAGFFVPPGNDEAIADAVLTLSQNRELARTMGRNGRACVEQDFDRDRQAEKFVELITRLAR